jgi:hypothetical protein
MIDVKRGGARFIVALAVVGGAVLVGACGSAPQESTQSRDDALQMMTCPAGYAPSCEYDPDAKMTVCDCVAVQVESDTCSPDTRPPPSPNPLLGHGCSTVPTDVLPTAYGGQGGVTVWQCDSAPTIPGWKIYGDKYTNGVMTAFEIVEIWHRQVTQYPACNQLELAGSQASGDCSYSSLRSSCYADPPYGKILVVEWYYLGKPRDGGNGCNGLCSATH